MRMTGWMRGVNINNKLSYVELTLKLDRMDVITTLQQYYVITACLTVKSFKF